MNLEGLPSAGQLFSIWTPIFIKFTGARMRLLGCIQALGLIVIKWGQTQAYMHTDVWQEGATNATLSLWIQTVFFIGGDKSRPLLCQPVTDIKLVHPTWLSSNWARNLFPIHPCENMCLTIGWDYLKKRTIPTLPHYIPFVSPKQDCYLLRRINEGVRWQENRESLPLSIQQTISE